jgi:YfiH family protein
MIKFYGNPPTHLTFDALAAAAIPHLSTTRHAPGVARSSSTASPFGENAWAFFGSSHLDLARTAYLSQVHGADVVRVGDNGFAGAGDILVTTSPGLPLAISTADCLAIVLADPDRRLLAAAHVGWRGTVQGATTRAVEALAALGARAGALVVAISPSIGPCCYEVDRPVVEPLGEAFPDRWEAWVKPVAPDRWMLDLWAANDYQLTAAGCRPDRIANPRLCTACRRDLFYSYRKERAGGRLVTAAALP